MRSVPCAVQLVQHPLQGGRYAAPNPSPRNSWHACALLQGATCSYKFSLAILLSLHQTSIPSCVSGGCSRCVLPLQTACVRWWSLSCTMLEWTLCSMVCPLSTLSLRDLVYRCLYPEPSPLLRQPQSQSIPVPWLIQAALLS